MSPTEADWARLTAHLHRRFRRHVDAATADDLVQESFLRLARNLPKLRRVDRVDALVARVAHSVLVDHLRRVRPREAIEELAAPDEEPDLSSEVAGWLPDFVDGLPPTYRDAVRMAELDGVTQRQIADELGLSVSGAKSRVQRGRRLLRERLEACCAFEFDHRGAIVDVERRATPERPCCDPPVAEKA